jgi:inosine/xanthosine triphosphate pyrophosphatase family protein
VGQLRLRLLQLLRQIVDRSSKVVTVLLANNSRKSHHTTPARGVKVERTYGKKRRGGEGVDPVLVPQEVEQLRVERRLEVRDLERVVLFTVHTKIFDLYAVKAHTE